MKHLIPILVAGLALVPGSRPAFSTDTFRQSPSTVDPASNVPPGMAFIPAGTAILGLEEQQIQEMGTENPAELKVLAGSVPRHERSLKAFFLDTFEVTNRQWQRFLEKTGREPSAELVKFSWIDGKIPVGQENHPVVCVSYSEAEAYCRFAMKRLPTEEEWEFAARGPEGLQYPWGNEFEGNKAHSATSTMKSPRTFQQVGTKADGVSPFGIHDMAGNIWEWTSSVYAPYDGYKDIKVKTRFAKGRFETFSASEFFNSQRRVIRGGAYDSKKLALLAAVRQGADKDTWYNTLGFRCAKSARAGEDALAYATSDVGAHNFRDHALDVANILAREKTEHDADGLVSAHTGFAFAGVLDWPKLRDVQAKSKRSPYVVGLLSSTESILVPRLPAGSYLVAYQAGDSRAKQKDATFPDEGWVFHGWEEHEPDFGKPEPRSVRPAKSTKEEKEKEKDEKATEEPSGAPAGEGEPAAGDESAAPEEPEYEAITGSVVYDRTKDNLLILDRRGLILAALPLDEVKDTGKPEAAKLTVQKVAKDDRRNLPASERYALEFSIPLPTNRSVRLELPLRFLPALFGSADSKPNADAAKAETGDAKVKADAARPQPESEKAND